MIQPVFDVQDKMNSCSGNLFSLCCPEERKNTKAIISAETGLHLTYGELAFAGRKISVLLKDKGVSAQSIVLLCFPVSIEFPIALFSVFAANAIATPIDRFIKQHALINLVQFSNPSAIITNESLLRKIPDEVKNSGTLVTIDVKEKSSQKDIIVKIYQNNTEPVTEIISCSSLPADTSDTGIYRHLQINPSDTGICITTSGTTGVSKIVMLGHKAVLENIKMHMESLDIDVPVVSLQTLEMNYSYGFIASFLSTLFYGGSSVLVSSLDASLFCDAIQKYKVNLWVGTPSLFRYLIDNLNDPQKKSLSSLKKITIGGDSCSGTLREKLRAALDNIEMYITYGITEAGPRISTLPSACFLEKPASVGLPLKGVEIKILKTADYAVECLPGETGVIAVRSPSNMSGYLGKPEITGKVLHNGWLFTGDLGRIDSEGFLYIIGRIDKQIKFRGRRINPKAIEDCINSYPHILYSKVSKEGEDGNSYLKADVLAADVSAPGNPVSEEGLKKHIIRHLPMYMVPAVFNFMDYNEYYFKGKRINERLTKQ